MIIMIVIIIIIIVAAIINLLLLWLSFHFLMIYCLRYILKTIQLYGIMLKLNPNHNIAYSRNKLYYSILFHYLHLKINLAIV